MYPFLKYSLIIALSGTITGHITNYYGTPTTLAFNKQGYTLARSAHPNSIYYKQEYLPKGETIAHFNNLITVDFLKTNITVKDAVAAQVKILQERKKTDQTSSYQVHENPAGTEYILDFLMNEGQSGGTNVIEWSAYHYKAYTDKAGHSGILLLGIVHRAYGTQTATFIAELSNYRTPILNELIRTPLPEIEIKR